MKKIILAVLFSVFLFSAFAGVQFIEEVAALEYTEYTGTLDGADWALRIPDPWNGMLVVICRGYSATIPNPLTAVSRGSYMLEQGFAVAASNYGSAGYCIQAGVNSTYELTMYVIDNYNVTGKVFLYGMSMGGAVALLLGEKYPDVYSGVFDLFGVKNLKDSHAIKTRWANLTDEELTAELTALTIPIPPFMFPTLQALRDYCASSVADIELETGGTPATHPQAYEDRSPTYHANIMIPVITVHGTSDALVLFNQSIMYQTAVANAGRSNLYRLYNVTGGQHGSGDVIAEVPARFDELVAWSARASVEVDWWPMFRHDLNHTGYSTSTAPTTNNTIWTYTTGDDVFSSPAVVDDRVYVGSGDRKVYCLDASTGTHIWNYTTGGSVFSSPAVAGGKVYVGSNNRKVYCLNASTGAHVWNYTTGSYVISCPAVVGGKVYIGSYDANVYCLDASTGTHIWNYTTGDGVYSPAVAGGRVYVGSDDAKVYCLDASTGTHVWSYTTGSVVGSPPAVAGGKVYVGSGDGKVYAFASLVLSTDSAGNSKATFDPMDNVYVRGKGFTADTDVTIYLVPDGADALPANAVANASTTTDTAGDLPVTLVWSQPLTLGEYDIWVDENQNGVFDGADVWDSQSIDIYPLDVIPEFSTWTSMLLIPILLTVAIVIYKRRLIKTKIH